MARTDSDDSRQEAILTLELSPEENEQVTSLSFIRFPDYHSPYQLLNMFLPPAPPCGQMLLLSSQFEIIPSSGKGWSAGFVLNVFSMFHRSCHVQMGLTFTNVAFYPLQDW